MQRLRIRYAKRGRARFTSGRDFGRAFERALRRAAVPMAYSSGFSPHPRISYANSAPTGAASEAEFLEVGLARRCDPARVREALDAALPEGLDVVEVVEAEGPALADRLTGSEWSIELDGVAEATLDRAIDDLWRRPAMVVERMTKSGLRSFDVRGALVSLSRDGTTLTVVLRHQTPLVRADDVLTALRALAPIGSLPAAGRLTRRRQGRLGEDGEIADPLTPPPQST